MKDAPIPLTLDLWSLGHAASDIAERLGFPNHRHVTRIVAHARSIGDRRAVIHRIGNTRKMLALLARYPDLEVVDPIPVRWVQPPKKLCRRGHWLTKKNTIVNASGRQCRKCKNLVHKASRARKRAR